MQQRGKEEDYIQILRFAELSGVGSKKRDISIALIPGSNKQPCLKETFPCHRSNALRPYLDIGMIERCWLFSETTLR
jgi:hypothetical protein